MTAPSAGPLFAWASCRPVAGPRAPEGVKRAVRAASRVDLAVLEVARRHAAGDELPLVALWSEVNALVTTAPDTPRRRLDALKDAGYVVLGDAKIGCVRVLWCRDG